MVVVVVVTKQMVYHGVRSSSVIDSNYQGLRHHSQVYLIIKFLSIDIHTFSGKIIIYALLWFTFGLSILLEKSVVKHIP